MERAKKPFYKKWWIWALGLLIALAAIGSNGTSTASPDTGGQQNSTVSPGTNNMVDSSAKNDVFSGSCGISATAEMGTDIIGQPTVTVSITNTSEKDIRAIQFYAVPVDVYGDELKGVFTQNKLYTDDSISAGSSDSITYQFLDNHVKSIKLYVYSVYFSDGTEWGDKDATKSVVMKKGMQIEVSGISGN